MARLMNLFGKKTPEFNLEDGVIFNKPPIDFTTRWELADFVVKTRNSEELLHANKGVLMENSHVINRRYTRDPEENQEEIELNVDFETMIDILNILHHIKRNKTFSCDELIKLYKVAELFEFPLVMEHFEKELARLLPKEALEITLELEIPEKRSKILKKMPAKDLSQLVKKNKINFTHEEKEIIDTKLEQQKKLQFFLDESRKSKMGRRNAIARTICLILSLILAVLAILVLLGGLVFGGIAGYPLLADYLSKNKGKIIGFVIFIPVFCVSSICCALCCRKRDTIQLRGTRLLTFLF